MTDNVLTFKPRRFEQVFECGNCRSQHFYILESMRIECIDCGKVSPNIFVPDEPPNNE